MGRRFALSAEHALAMWRKRLGRLRHLRALRRQSLLFRPLGVLRRRSLAFRLRRTQRPHKCHLLLPPGLAHW
jgi:hypothetical protein